MKNPNQILPESLAGYQHVVSGIVHPEDLWVLRGRAMEFVKQHEIGTAVQSLSFPGWAIYRKMPCPNACDSDTTTGWKKKQEELRAEALRKEGAAQQRMGHDNPYLWAHINDGDASAKEVIEAVEADRAKAATYDEGKPPLAYLPWGGIDEVAMVQAYGHKKYKDYNNYRKGMEIGRNLSCAIRHIRAFMEGEDLDKESGRSHLAHAACRLLFVLQNQKDGTAIDDRYKKS